ncbi:MAG: arsenic resistance N-acetyltransferase ArsN2 [Chloroflexota bacterium]
MGDPALISVEPATPADLAAMLTLLEQSGLPQDGLSDHFEGALLARNGQDIVGCAAIEIYGQAGLLRSVAVAEAWRGQSLGRRLTEKALTLARQRGLTELYLLTETAGDFFPRFGFTPIARAEVPPAVQQSVEFSTACPASALVMRLRLP